MHKHSQLLGFLCDGCIIQFFKLVNNAEKHLYETPVYALGSQGGNLLWGLLNTKDILSLGHSAGKMSYQDRPLRIQSNLGMGSSSSVYRGELNNQQIVIKRFTNQEMYRLPEEKRNLELLHAKLQEDKRSSIPHLTGTTDDGTALLLSPIGWHFAVVLGDLQRKHELPTRY